MLKNLPLLSGVYLFKDKAGKIIYIGKSRSIRNRVKSYFQKDQDYKTKSLIKEACEIGHIVTHNEIEAFLLEAKLIFEHQPKYNILLKDGQPFVYIIFTLSTLPKIKIVRNKKENGVHFGPFLKKQEARKIYDFLVKTFRLKLCNKRLDNGCLDYHLDICAGTCLKEFDTEGYLFRFSLAKKALKGEYKKATKLIKESIKKHNDSLEFEKAKYLQTILIHFESIHENIKTRFSENKFEKEILKQTLSVEPENVAIQLQKILELEKPANTVDCFDISHFQGHNIVGSCIRFNNGIPEKNKFRRFKIKSLTNQDDCKALIEIVSRRYKNNDFPDVILIDGGKGQRNAITSIIKNRPIISLAKKEEIIFSDNHTKGFKLNLDSSTGKLLIQLRDYAHHFAISYHRALKKKELK